jgi:hypothetical protein
MFFVVWGAGIALAFFLDNVAQDLGNFLQASKREVSRSTEIALDSAPMQASIRIPITTPALDLLLPDGIVHAPTAVKGKGGNVLKPITRECLCTDLIVNGEDIGLCLLGPPKLSVGRSGHRAYFLCNDKRHIMLPNTCDPTSIAQLALLGNKKSITPEG